MLHSVLTAAANSQTTKQVKNLLSSIVKGKTTAIDRQLVDNSIRYGTNPSDAPTFFEVLFEEIDVNASHQYAILKLLFLLQTIVNQKNNQINSLLRKYLPDIQTITMLTFEDKKSVLRRQIHNTAEDIYQSLAFGKQLDQETVNLATQMTFIKPVAEDPTLLVNKPNKPPQKQTQNQPAFATTAIGGLNWIDNSDDEENAKPQNDQNKDIQGQNLKKKEEEDENDLGPDPFEDFVGYDPFESLVVPENFSTKFIHNVQSNPPTALAFF